jgi:hypothetical protein
MEQECEPPGLRHWPGLLVNYYYSAEIGGRAWLHSLAGSARSRAFAQAAAAVAGWAQELGSVGVPGPPARDTPGPGRGLGHRLVTLLNHRRCTCKIAAHAAASQGGSLIVCRLRMENAV